MESSVLNPASLKQCFIRQVEHTIKQVRADVRDPWPASLDAYEMRGVLSKGKFGEIKIMATYDNDLMSTDGNASRTCAIKTVFLNKFFDRVVQESREKKKPTLLQVKSPKESLERILRRIGMELFVNMRCRHENILHFHAVFLNSDGLNLAMPRFHVLREMIDTYRDLHNYEPIPMAIIARIVRQLCEGLNYLHSAGIIHRDIQPENILMTRNGTVKLYHFGQAKALVSEQTKAECRTPVGKEEFMSSEKLFNLREARSLEACRSYSFDADIWSVGVLVLSMISYFPNEKFHKLRKDFARVLDKEQMPFIWLTSDMVQLRARLLKSGGEDLKGFLNDHIFTVDPTLRLTARGILDSERFLQWCSLSVMDDKLYIKKKFIGEVDFANREKLAVEGNNFDALESKNIPAEFYWNDSWKALEETQFEFKLLSIYRSVTFAEKIFQFSDPDPLFSVLYAQIENELIGMADVIPIHCEAHQMAFELMEEVYDRKQQKHLTVEKTISREYQPCQSFNTIENAPLLIQMSFRPHPRRRLSSNSHSITPSASFIELSV